MKRALLLASALSLVLLGVPASAGPAPAAPAKPVLAKPVLAAIKAGQPMRMTYELEARAHVLFIPATGKALFKVDMLPETYTIDSLVKVTGIADWFVNYDLVLKAVGETRAGSLKTTTYVSKNNDGKKNRKVELAIGAKDFTMTANPKFGNLGDPAATAAQVIQTNDPITALITFALEPRAAGADPCGGPIRIFDGRQLTYLHLKNAGEVNVKTTAWSGKAIECHVTMDKVAGYKVGEANKDTLTGIEGPLRMWLAPLPNGAAVPVKIEADTEKLGKIKLQAKQLKFEPLPMPNPVATGRAR
jgi:Protein of unknown function (DUF3108)